MVLDESFLVPYSIADTALTHGLKTHLAGSDSSEHPSHAHLAYLRQQRSAAAMHVEDGSIIGQTGFEQTQVGYTFEMGGSEAPGSRTRTLRRAAFESSKARARNVVNRRSPRIPSGFGSTVLLLLVVAFCHLTRRTCN